MDLGHSHEPRGAAGVGKDPVAINFRLTPFRNLKDSVTVTFSHFQCSEIWHGELKVAASNWGQFDKAYPSQISPG